MKKIKIDGVKYKIQKSKIPVRCDACYKDTNEFIKLIDKSKVGIHAKPRRACLKCVKNTWEMMS